MKPKQNRKGQKNKSVKYDRCQTPFYALDPLIPYLRPEWQIWEPACGDGQIVTKLTREGFKVTGTDILTGFDFFNWQPNFFHCQITNPPYSIKYDWLRRSYGLNKPMALLLPLETLGAAQAQELFENYGLELILMNKRVNFNMPNKGYSGSGAQFPVAWFTWGLNIGEPITYAHIGYYQDEQIPLFDRPLVNPAGQICFDLMEYHGA